jgi:hypothetical protein
MLYESVCWCGFLDEENTCDFNYRRCSTNVKLLSSMPVDADKQTKMEKFVRKVKNGDILHSGCENASSEYPSLQI